MPIRVAYISLASRFFRPQLPAALRGSKCVGRLLLVLIALICAVTPYTESLWSWDGFARGGQDMELGVMCFVATLGLAMVLLRQAQRLVHRLLQLAANGSPSRGTAVSAPECRVARRRRRFDLAAPLLDGPTSVPLRI